MSIKAPQVISEFTLVKFDVLGNTYTKTPSEAIAFTEGLLATTHATTLKFTELVPCRTLLLQDTSLDKTRLKLEETRTVVVEQNNSKMNHALHLCYLKGPLSPKEFISMMQFKEGISSEAWEAHIDRFSAIQPRSRL
jgi:hypothetical protein